METQKITPLKWGGENLQDVITRLDDLKLASADTLRTMLMVILNREYGGISCDHHQVIHVGDHITIHVCDHTANLTIAHSGVPVQTTSTWNLLTEMQEMVYYLRDNDQ